MIIETVVGVDLESDILFKYLKNLVNLFFKILPMKENNEQTLLSYMKNLQAELLGCKNVILALNSDPMFLSLISILQFLIDSPDCEISEVKSEVFKAISICNKLHTNYASKCE